MEKRIFNYSDFPDALAPRRFEIINTDISDDAVFGHGVEMYGGLCIVERPGSDDYDRLLGFASIEDVKKQVTIRWIDPPFER